ncbi:porin [Burkholderia sp. Ax-1719]|uniref:porin n=1 Tax=Burkholderia sp. Ax-1719 TaxID=2608334 RepID=UPI0014246D0C|nr:porin [Burkholderia sp. Ax-1719]NIE64441.1 porin [Burkholderia sp. Ax-1719]
MSSYGALRSAFARTAIIAAISSLPVSVWAQSSVTLYGVLDAGLIYTNKSYSPVNGQNGGKQFAMVSSGLEPSVFGLSGQEDLGGGFKAKFKLESGISLANGGFDNTNGGLFGRQAWLSLASPYGELKAGLQFSPYILALYDSDPRSMGQFGSNISVYANNTFTGTFVSNAITYISPKVAGFTASLMYALGGVAGDFKAGRQYSGSLKFESAGLMLNAAVYDASAGRDEALNSTLFEIPLIAKTFGAAYTISSFTIKGSFTNYKAPMTTLGDLVGGGNHDVWNLGFSYYVTPALNINSGVWYLRDPHDSSTHGLLVALGTQYSLSRRTSLYAQVGMTNNRGRSTLGLDVDGALQGVNGTTIGGGVGVIHKF